MACDSVQNDAKFADESLRWDAIREFWIEHKPPPWTRSVVWLQLTLGAAHVKDFRHETGYAEAGSAQSLVEDALTLRAFRYG